MQTIPRRLWRKCEKIVDGLSIPVPFDFQEFVDALGAQRGRPIVLAPLTVEPGRPYGLAVSTDSTDYVFYAVNTTPLHRDHIRFHEIAHLVCGHVGGTVPEMDVLRMLMPSLSPELIERVLGRTVYSEPEERTAELLAYLIMRRVRHLPMHSDPEPRMATTLSRLSSAFDTPRARHV